MGTNYYLESRSNPNRNPGTDSRSFRELGITFVRYEFC